MTRLSTVFNNFSGRLRANKWSTVIMAARKGATVLDVGVWCRMPEPHPAENWLEKQSPYGGNLVAVGLDDMRAFHRRYPEALCVQADGCALPFKADAVDYAVANAVLEHVSVIGQKDFVAGLKRVARLQAILTVPDRLCPVEAHSRIPFIHWLPSWRSIYYRLGEKFWCLPKNLSTIFTRKALSRLLRDSTGVDWQVKSQKLFGLPISLIAWITKSEDARYPGVN